MSGSDLEEMRPVKEGGRLRGWVMLASVLGLMWLVTYLLLPWAQNLPLVRPVMRIIADADIDAGAYFYTQSEETARAQMYVRNSVEPPCR
jgi:hypothetical protein